MLKTHVKKGEEVVIIAGREKGKRGKIIEVQRGTQRVIVEGTHMIKRHTKKNQQQPNGAIVEREECVNSRSIAELIADFHRAGFLDRRAHV